VDQLGNGDAPGPGGKRRPRGWLWVAGDPSTSRSGAWTLGRVTGHMLAAQPSWVRGRPTTFGEARQLSGVSFVFLEWALCS
jgi:hypothetical protein